MASGLVPKPPHLPLLGRFASKEVVAHVATTFQEVGPSWQEMGAAFGEELFRILEGDTLGGH